MVMPEILIDISALWLRTFFNRNDYNSSIGIGLYELQVRKTGEKAMASIMATYAQDFATKWELVAQNKRDLETLTNYQTG